VIFVNENENCEKITNSLTKSKVPKYQKLNKTKTRKRKRLKTTTKNLQLTETITKHGTQNHKCTVQDR